MVNKGLLVRLEVQPGRDTEAEHFLESLLPLVREEPDTTAWFALRFGRSEYGIFGVFPDKAARKAHLGGDVARLLLGRAGSLFSGPPQVHKLSLLASKLPPGRPAHLDTKALLLTFRAHAGRESQLELFLRNTRSLVEGEAETSTWFAFHQDSGEYGIFDTFPDKAGRFRHLLGQVPRELARHARELLGSVPDMEMLNVLTGKGKGENK